MADTLLLALSLAGVFVAIAVTLTTVGVITSERQQVGRSLAAVEALRTVPSAQQRELNKPFADRVLAPGLVRLTRLGRRFTPSDQVARVRTKLELAGNPPEWDVDRVLALKVLGLIAGLPIGLALALLFGLGLLPLLAVTGGCGLIGYFTPNMVLYQISYNRREQMRRELPDALDLLTISVEAGLSFDAGLAQVARNTTGPMAEEFFRVLQEMQIGLGRTDALRALGDRTDLPELRGFVTAMVQADTYGIPIAAVLRVQAKEMRLKRTQHAEEQAGKVPVKILFPLIFCILPALFVVILGPAAITVFEAFRESL